MKNVFNRWVGLLDRGRKKTTGDAVSDGSETPAKAVLS